ncbi:MAG: DUF6263 family protein [Planctomycetes bacterium]|nr:DUF6263 family protein [Planctomycetota bacterium]
MSGVLILMMLAAAGCQGQRAETPATRVGAADGAAPEALPSVSRASSPRSEGGTPSTREAPHSVAPDEGKSVPAKVSKAELSGPAVELALKFVPGQAATYRLTTESYKSVEWKGAQAAKPPQFTDGRTGSLVELTFEQRVQQVQDDGNAVLEITIRGVKEVIESVNKVVLDFDSARPTDSENPLAALVGKSYRVKMSPQGQVLEISNVEPARKALQGILPGHRVAAKLLADEEIRNRHEIVALSALKDRQVRPGQTWSSIKTFSFDDLGAKTYERVYTLKQVQQNKDRQAIVEMKAIPSAAQAEQWRKQQTVNPFAGLSDNTDNYEGRLVLDLDRGQVREYVEEMQNEWVIADPGSMQAGQPTAIKMAARRLHRLERME